MSTLDESVRDDVIEPAAGRPPAEASLARVLWRERWAVLGCVLVGALAGALLSQGQSPEYTAQSRVFLSAQAEFDPLGQGQGGDVGRFVQNQLALMGSTSVLLSTITALDLGTTPTRLADRLRLSAGDDSTVITVRATASTPDQAKRIADGIPAAYRTLVRDRVAARAAQVESATKDETTLASIRTAQAVYGDGVGTVDAALRPAGRSSPQPMRDGLLLALAGLLAGAGYALFTQSPARRRVGPAEAAAIFGAALLGEIPDRGRLDDFDAIAPAPTEPGDAYRMAAVGLDYIRGAAPGVFLVTAPHDGAGTSLTALNLAAAAADHGRKVFLLDIEDTVRPPADTDSPRVPLHELAQGRVDLGYAVERRASRARFGIIRLQVQQPVQGHPVADVQQILDQLPDDTDLVLLDAPPLPSSSASFVLAGQVDAAVAVVDDATTPAALEELDRRCRLAGIPVAGVLVNHIRPHPGQAGRRRRSALPADLESGTESAERAPEAELAWSRAGRL